MRGDVSLACDTFIISYYLDVLMPHSNFFLLGPYDVQSI